MPFVNYYICSLLFLMLFTSSEYLVFLEVFQFPPSTVCAFLFPLPLCRLSFQSDYFYIHPPPQLFLYETPECFLLPLDKLANFFILLFTSLSSSFPQSPYSTCLFRTAFGLLFLPPPTWSLRDIYMPSIFWITSLISLCHHSSQHLLPFSSHIHLSYNRRLCL